MKKTLTYIAFISMALLSCKKDHKPTTDPASKLYTVQFSLASFSQTITNGKTTYSVPPTSANVEYLVYQLYDASNTLKKSLVVPYTATDFGTFRDSLKAGNYTAVFAGFSGEYQISGSKYSTLYADNENYGDFFYKKIAFTVSASNISQSVALDRQSAEIQVVIKDAIPANIKRIEVYADFDMDSYDLSTGIPFAYHLETSAYSFTTIQPADIGVTGYQPSKVIHIYNTVTPMSVIISAYDNSGGNGTPSYKKTVSNILCKPNTRTILTGNVFSGDTTGVHGFGVTFKSSFDADTIKKHF